MVSKENDVRVVRIYITEGDHKVRSLMGMLHDEEKVSGVTVFRGISGFGKSGTLHTSKLIDLSFDLPLVIEFFDEPERIAEVLERLGEKIEPVHVISWPAKTNLG